MKKELKKRRKKGRKSIRRSNVSMTKSACMRMRMRMYSATIFAERVLELVEAGKRIKRG